jgi:dihydroflavonol-4-reductase
MKRACVTGGTGFVGAHVVRALLERGVEVTCLARETSPRLTLEGLAVRVATGDLTDLDSLRRAIAGADTVFHCAADYRLYVESPDAMYAANVDGTRNVMRAAAEHGVERVVHTSSVGALGLDPAGRPADETAPVGIEDMKVPYKRSKYLAERMAEEWAGRGLPVVIVNPSTPVGELDVKPTATGRMILDYLDGKMNAYVETGLNLVDVRDVAAGHVLAAEKGVPGEKYILGHRDMTLKQIFDVLARITGIRAPRLKLPHWVPLMASAVDTSIARLRGKPPRLSLDAVRLSRYRMYFDAGKAVRELGLPQSPVEPALERAVRWFREHGYVARSAAA